MTTNVDTYMIGLAAGTWLVLFHVRFQTWPLITIMC